MFSTGKNLRNLWVSTAPAHSRTDHRHDFAGHPSNYMPHSSFFTLLFSRNARGAGSVIGSIALPKTGYPFRTAHPVRRGRGRGGGGGCRRTRAESRRFYTRRGSVPTLCASVGVLSLHPASCVLVDEDGPSDRLGNLQPDFAVGSLRCLCQHTPPTESQCQKTGGSLVLASFWQSLPACPSRHERGIGAHLWVGSTISDGVVTLGLE